MIDFELEDVAGGWDQARFGPSDQVDYVVRTDAGAVASYDSVHTLLKLYDLARIERASHPRFLGFEVRELGPDGAIAVGIHGHRAETTYAELRAAMEPFLAELFRALDEESVGGAPEREDHVAAIVESDEVLVDLAELYERLTAER
jgi:hypothetical protein